MARFVGTIFQGDQVIVDRVMGDLKIEDAGAGITRYRGTLELPNGAVLKTDETYRLVLENGQVGTIAVTNASYSRSGFGTADFMVNGPLT